MPLRSPLDNCIPSQFISPQYRNSIAIPACIVSFSLERVWDLIIRLVYLLWIIGYPICFAVHLLKGLQDLCPTGSFVHLLKILNA